MHFNKLALAAATTAIFAVARADVDLDDDDIPRECRDICEPVDRLADICDDIDDDGVDDYTERLLEAQCFCTNDSFDVSRVTSECAACMWEHNRDRDDNEDIDDLMHLCGFSSTSYASDAQATGVTVSADRNLRSADLTTTITGGGNQPTGSDSGPGADPTATDDGGSGGGGNGNDNGNNGDNSDSQDNNNDDDDNAAGLAAPFGANVGGMFAMGAYVVAAAAAGAVMMQ